MNNHHQSEQFGQDTDEHRTETQASLKSAMQGFIEELRLNLKAFLTTGLELDELCPNVVYGDSCADRLVLLSAHKDGILRIDDSHCKRRWKPGPEWAKLEGLLP